MSWKDLNDEPPKLPVSWRSTVKRLLRPVISTGFRAWHRVKAVDRWAPDKSIFVQEPRSYPGHGEVVVKTVHGFNIIVDGGDADHTPKIIFGDDVELREELAVKEILKGGDWVIEIAPRSAAFCMLAAQRVGSFGRVFAYQHDPAISSMVARSSVMNRMHDRIIVRPVKDERSERTAELKSNARRADLDQEFPIDLPIKLLKIGVESDAAIVLNGAKRLLERRCIDFVQIGVLTEPAIGSRWRRELGGTRLSELMVQLNYLMDVGYNVCTISQDGSLMEHKNVTVALDRLETRSVILKARDQYTRTDTSNHP